MMKKFVCWCAVMACGVSWTIGADEQRPVIKDDTTRFAMPEVVIVGDRYQSIREGLEKIPGGVEMITAPQMDRTRASNLGDVLYNVPGVFAQPRQGSADESTLSIRGSGIRNTFHLRGIQLYMDGVLLSNPDGFSDYDVIELLAMDRIEVFKGANGLSLGAHALGGAINFVSKTAHESKRFKVRMEGGSYGFMKEQFSASQKFVDGVDYYISTTAQREDGYRQHQDLERERFYGNMGWRLFEGTDLRCYFVAVNSRNELAGDLTKSQLQHTPRFAAATAVSQNTRRDTEILRGAVSVTHRIDDDQRLETNLYYQWKDLDHPLAFAFVDNEFNNGGVEMKYFNTSPLAGLDNEFIFGLTPQYGRILDAFYENRNGSRGALTKNQVDETYNMAAWVQDTCSIIPDWKAVAGTGFLWSGRELTDRFRMDGDASGELNYLGFSPRLGLIYDFTKNIQIFGNLSMAYEPPTFSEQLLSTTSGLVNIQPQRSYIVEMGSRGQWERMDWDVSIYDAEIEDELFNNNLGNTGISLLSNIPRTRHLGVELGHGFKIWEGLFQVDDVSGKKDFIKLQNTYTWSDFRIVSDGPYTGKRLPGIPEHRWIVEWLYQHPVGFYYSFNIQITPDSYFVDKANNLQNDGWTILGMKSGMEFKNGLKLFGELRNITDVIYSGAISTTEIATPTSAQFKPADGFGLYGGIEWNF